MKENIFNFILDDLFSTKTYEVKSDDNQISLSLIAPGHKKEDFSVELKGDKLNIEMPQNVKKVFRIPPTVHTDNVSAVYEAGILKIFFNKKQVASKKIPIS